MKRLNPTTGKPFCRGDIRDDGLVFFQYKLNKKLNRSGFFKEHWTTIKNLEKFKLSAYDNRRSMYGSEKYEKRKEEVKNYSKKYLTVPKGRAKHMITTARKRFPVSITPEWLEQKIKKGVCELTGLRFDLLQSNFSQNPYAPSLDRIDSSIKEYTEKNTRVVLVAVNNAINQYGDETMLPILKAMVKSINKNVKQKQLT